VSIEASSRWDSVERGEKGYDDCDDS
jgi:hypothetical protein